MTQFSERSRFFAAGLALATASALLRFWALAQTPFANGWDSYFYLIQVKSWVETGRMHSPEASLIYPLMRAVLWFSGDYVLMYKVSAALLAGVFTGVVFRFWGFLPAAWTVFSPHLTYFAAQYPKNLLGVVLLLAFVGCVRAFLPRMNPGVNDKSGGLKPAWWEGCVRAVVPRMNPGVNDKSSGLKPAWWEGCVRAVVPRMNPGVNDKSGGLKPAWWVLLATLLILNYFGHRLAFGLAVAFAVFYLFFSFGKDWVGRFFTLKNLLVAGLFLAVVALAGWAFPGLFHVSDFERLWSGRGWKLMFTPWLFVREFWPDGRLSVFGLLEIGVSVGALVFAAFRFFKNKNLIASELALFFTCLLLLWPVGEWSLTGLAFRCFLVFVLLMPMLFPPSPLKGEFPAVVGVLANNTPECCWRGRQQRQETGDTQDADGFFQNDKLRADGFFQNDKKRNWKMLAVALLLAAALFSWKSYAPARHDPDYHFFEKITVAAQKRLAAERPELVIAHNALAEFFTFTTGTDAMPWLPEYPIEAAKLWRIAAGFREQELRYFLKKDDPAALTRLPGNYFLLRESDWQQILENARAEGDKDFLQRAANWQNPNRMRPAFLLRRKQ